MKNYISLIASTFILYLIKICLSSVSLQFFLGYKMQPFSLYFLNLCKIHNKNVVTSLIFNILFHLSQFFCIKTQITLHCMTSEYSISPTKKRLPTRQSSKNIQLHFAYINRRISSVNSSPEVAYSKVFRGYWFTQSSIH